MYFAPPGDRLTRSEGDKEDIPIARSAARRAPRRFRIPRSPLTSLKCASDCIAGTATPRDRGKRQRERKRKRINIPAICMRGGALVRFDVAARAGAYIGIFALIQSDGMRPPRINIFRIIRLCLR